MNLKEFKQVKSKGGDKKIMKTKIKQEKGITLIALVITMIVPYDKMKECCNM